MIETEGTCSTAEESVLLFPDRRILTVTQLTSLVRGVMEENFEHVWVEGEVSNFSAPGSGHLYFTLKDAGAQLRCVMFRASARFLKFRPKDGMGLIVRGRMTVFEQRGEYQLVADYTEPRGVGALQLAFIQLKERLAREGLFDEERKRPLPPLPRRIGVVTSASGAAIHDILTILDRRFANLEVLLRPVKVQGEGAAEDIAAAIREFNRYREIDVLIVGRGGGSLEDLWAFNEEVLARAIHGSKIPVISAVGHETDFTIADFVADLRAPTPSAAAELVIRSKEELDACVAALSHRLRLAMQTRLAALTREVTTLGRCLKDPSLLLGHLGQRVDHLHERLCGAACNSVARRVQHLSSLHNHLRLVTPSLQVERARERLIALAARGEQSIQRIVDGKRQAAAVGSGKLHALSPLRTLARGYAVVTSVADGKIVRDAGALAPGDRLDITLQRGGATCLVEKSHS